MSTLSHRDRALQLFQLGDYRGAANAFGQALGEQESAELWNDWATCQFQAGRFAEAEEGYRQALELDGTNPELALNLGLLLHRTGRKSEAKPWLEKAVRRLPAAAREPVALILAGYRQEQHTEPHPSAASPSAFLQNLVGDPAQEQAYFEARLDRHLEVLKALPDASPGQRLLEVGAKFHHLTPALSALKGYEVRCARFSEAQSQSIAKVLSKDGSQGYCFTVDNFDLQDRPWPYPDEAFDVVICCDVLEDFLGAPEGLLAEVERILKPSGLLLLTLPNRLSHGSQRRPTRSSSADGFPDAGHDAPAASSATSLVCLQTMWRSCGTYLWSKFRANGAFRTYDEPCHERLLTATPLAFEEEKSKGITHTLRHPELDKHYFAEFPFREKGGVEFFRKRFSFEDYYLPENAADAELKTYVENLISHAHARGQRPLAKFCRFGLRAAWLKKQFTPISIYVLRNPDAMFRSYWSLGGRDSYFLTGLLLITSKNQRLAIFQEFAERYNIPYIERATVEDEITDAHRFLQTLDHQALRDLFLLHWALTYDHNAAISDLMLDIDLLASNTTYRSNVETQLSSVLDIRISFEDVRQSRVAEAPGVVASAWAVSSVGRALSYLHPSPRQHQRWMVGPGSADVLNSIYGVTGSHEQAPSTNVHRLIFPATSATAHRYSPEEIERLVGKGNFVITRLSTSSAWPAHFRQDLRAFASRGVPISGSGDQILCLATKTIPSKASDERGPGAVDKSLELTTGVMSAEKDAPVVSARPLRVLVVHEQPLRPTRNGSDVRLMQVLREFRAQGHQVAFIARNGDNYEEGERLLREIGVASLVHDSERLHCFGKDDPVKWQLEQVLHEGEFDLAVLTLWFWRSISVPEHYLDDIRRLSPKTRIAVLTDDQHGLREMRMAELRQCWSDYERALDHGFREREIYRRADFVLSISDDDRRGLLQDSPELTIDLLPMVAEPASAGLSFDERADFLFVGNFGNPANKNGVQWLLKEVWPDVRRRLPSACISLVGDNLPPEFASAADGVRPIGHVVDLEPLFAQHRVFVAPIRFGTGIKTKNLSALTHGIPLVTTTVGAEGLKLIHGTHGLIEDTADAFANQMSRSYTDKDLWNRLAAGGQTHVASEFGQQRLRQAVHTLAQNAGTTVPKSYDSPLSFSCRFVETRWPEVLTHKPASYREWLRLSAYASLAEESLRQNLPQQALEQMRHMFSMAQSAAYDLALFRHVKTLIAECYKRLGEDNRANRILHHAGETGNPSLPATGVGSAALRRPAPKISVVIPTYNRRSALRACLAHLGTQTLHPDQWEIVVVDDGSTDGTEEIIKQTPHFCHLEYIQQQHFGIGAARRAAVERARGELLLLLKDDSTPYDNLLAEHLRLQNEHKHEKIAVLGGRVYSREAAQNALTYFLAGNPLFFGQTMLPAGLQGSEHFFFGHNLSVRREAVLRVGSFDPDFRCGEDVELGIRLQAAGYRVLLHLDAKSDHNHLHADVAELLRKARMSGQVQLRILRKHPHLLGRGKGPLGSLHLSDRRRIQTMLKENRREVLQSVANLTRLNAFDFTPYLGSEVQSKRATEVLNAVKTLVPRVFWFTFFEGLLESWMQEEADYAGQDVDENQMRSQGLNLL